MMPTDIDIEIVNFQIRTGKKPTNIYLGKKQWKELMQWASESYSYAYPKKGIDIPEYRKCKVYKVQVHNHLVIA